MNVDFKDFYMQFELTEYPFSVYTAEKEDVEKFF